jgi:site-specific DNA-methyltransferase (adenine-specific)
MTDDSLKAVRQCLSKVWITPNTILDCVRQYFGGHIPLDPCTEFDNPSKALEFFTEADNGLSKSWYPAAFVNPPYGKETKLWLQKIAEEAHKGTVIILLLSVTRSETEYWQRHILTLQQNTECFIRRRVNFLKPIDVGETRQYIAQAGNTVASAIYGFNTNPVLFCDSFKSLGGVRTVWNWKRC